MPIIKIKKIKNSILRSNYLFKNGVPIPLNATIALSTNCYAYSLGITIYNKRKRIKFNPGFTNNLKYDKKSIDDLLEKVCIDLKNLGIPFRQLTLKDEKNLDENEYLIKVFYHPPTSLLPQGDYHFIRQDKRTGKWFHKQGWFNQPEIVEFDPTNHDFLPGNEPNAYEGYFNFTYIPVCYFAIKELAIPRKPKFLPFLYKVSNSSQNY